MRIVTSEWSHMGEEWGRQQEGRRGETAGETARGGDHSLGTPSIGRIIHSALLSFSALAADQELISLN